MILRRRNRPEPFKTFDEYDRRPRWGLWIFAGIVAIAAAGLVTMMSHGTRRTAERPPSVAAAVQPPAVPAPADPESAAAPDVRPVPPAAPPPQPQPSILAAPQPQPSILAAPQPQPAVAEPAAEESAEPPVREVVTTGRSGSNLRSAPSMSGAVLWTAPAGTRLHLSGEEGMWVKVQTTTGERAGWMHRSLVADP
jgi:hypothetical protein